MNDYALILGISSGMGEATARELMSKGINVYGIDIRKSNDLLEDLNKIGSQNNTKILFKKMSATNIDKRKEVINELLSSQHQIRIKILFHSLAFGALKPFLKINGEHITQKNIEMTLDVMSNSLVYWVQDLFENNLLTKGSQIFAMTSSGGHRQWPSYGAVSMAKASLESACRQLAFELAQFNIASNSIQAGVTDTPALRKIPGNEKMIKNATKINPSGRLTTPEDIAKIVALLGLSEETWITGNNIRADGGEDITTG
tara:strand:+ start:154 stop:927 length:774 start_codon:yes stop_codon:yes gene_type:complete